jgi:hypothetical protein
MVRVGALGTSLTSPRAARAATSAALRPRRAASGAGSATRVPLQLGGNAGVDDGADSCHHDFSIKLVDNINLVDKPMEGRCAS